MRHRGGRRRPGQGRFVRPVFIVVGGRRFDGFEMRIDRINFKAVDDQAVIGAGFLRSKMDHDIFSGDRINFQKCAGHFIIVGGAFRWGKIFDQLDVTHQHVKAGWLEVAHFVVIGDNGVFAGRQPADNHVQAFVSGDPLDGDAIASHVGVVIEQALEQNRRQDTVRGGTKGHGDSAKCSRTGFAFVPRPVFPMRSEHVCPPVGRIQVHLQCFRPQRCRQRDCAGAGDQEV